MLVISHLQHYIIFFFFGKTFSQYTTPLLLSMAYLYEKLSRLEKTSKSFFFGKKLNKKGSYIQATYTNEFHVYVGFVILLKTNSSRS